MDLSTLKTEARNPLTENIDQVSTLEMLRIINSEDQKVALAVEFFNDTAATEIYTIPG